MDRVSDLRPSPIAGQWYAGDAKHLSESVNKHIDAANIPEISGEIIAIIAPHAGHLYSGPVAGYAFGVVKDLNPDLVAVISPMHQPYFEPLLTSGHDAYNTPLGTIPIDKPAVQELDTLLHNDLGFGLKAVRKDREHSLEIELPFLQESLAGEFSLLPVMVRDQSVRVTKALGISLSKVVQSRKSLLVASTDLSHFYSQKAANKFDKEMLRRIENFDPIAVLDAESEKVGFACGRGAVAAVLWAAKHLGGDSVKILNYATSGDINQDYTQVVGYGAAVITKN